MEASKCGSEVRSRRYVNSTVQSRSIRRRFESLLLLLDVDGKERGQLFSKRCGAALCNLRSAPMGKGNAR